MQQKNADVRKYNKTQIKRTTIYDTRCKNSIGCSTLHKSWHFSLWNEVASANCHREKYKSLYDLIKYNYLSKNERITTLQLTILFSQ